MPKKKVFGITCNTKIIKEYKVAGEKFTGVFRDYIQALLLAGAIPVLLPPLEDHQDILSQIQHLDFIIVSGGQDVHPQNYGQEPSILLEKVCHERDQYELQLVKIAYENKIPIFGICRGLQIINVAFGGTLFQDVSEFGKETLLHRHPNTEEEILHHVDILIPSKLYDIFKMTPILANSYHHQGIKKLAKGFIANALASDGFIEGIEKTEGSFIMAVQWHPEMMVSKDQAMLKLFQYLINFSN